MTYVKLYTYGGLIPPLAYLLLPSSLFMSQTLQSLTFTYTCMIIVFISGIHWHIGLINKQDKPLLFSICIMLSTFIVCAYSLNNSISAFSWLAVIISLIVIYCFDYLLSKKNMIDVKFLLLRRNVSSTYVLIISVIMARTYLQL